eukprot:CAMPEP_0172184144 /NCGR_PEP_ID=MMETSP1050-20130122/19403_1 /TAXON_ID=233186 /ORGANISM="Cryptomonas curvata, Strain CCAP979/52" /LENGTH=42 /DNA_ID= /DNA_START= /DNA_END= /DNA_ORIENTATION=
MSYLADFDIVNITILTLIVKETRQRIRMNLSADLNHSARTQG